MKYVSNLLQYRTLSKSEQLTIKGGISDWFCGGGYETEEEQEEKKYRPGSCQG